MDNEFCGESLKRIADALEEILRLFQILTFAKLSTTASFVSESKLLK